MNANWSQLNTLLWLRWRLTRNQWARSGGLGPFLAIISTVLGIMLAAGAGIGGILGGALGLAKAPTEVVLIVWDVLAAGFLFLWLLGVLTEIQRAESIDLGRLLHLPVSLKGIFVTNYLTSHITPGIVIFLPASLGLALGMMWSKGWLMILLFPLVLTFVFMITAWTYCLRGWLVSLMVNPRQRRNVVVGLTLGFVLLAQLPNLYVNVYMRRQHRLKPAVQASTAAGEKKGITFPPEYLLAHKVVPVLWLPNGALELASGNAVPAILGTLGGLLLGIAGLARAYRSTLRFYQGAEKGGAAKVVARPAPGGVRKPILLERELRAVPPEVAALALAFFRSMTRAPEVKMAVAVNVMMLVAMSAVFFSGRSGTPNEFVVLFMGTGGVAITFFGLLQVLFNQFGFDRDGFRALILLPAARRDVLLGKNLAFAPIVAALCVPLLVLLVLVVHLPAMGLVASVFQLCSMFLLLSIAGNLLSTLVPYRVSAGSLKPTKPPPKTVILIMFTHLLFPVVMAPIFISPALAALLKVTFDLPAALLDALFSLIVLAISAVAYWASLPALGRLLEKKEQGIMLVVSQEVE